MQRDSLKITIVTAVYNRVDTIGQTIKSVRSQTYKNLEHIIIDGNSSDGTQEIINSFSYSNMMVVSEKDDGIYFALNKGFLNSSGDIVGILHSDDTFSNPEVLQKIIEAFKDPKVSAVYGDLDYVSNRDPSKIVRHWKAGNFSKLNLAFGWMPPHPTLFLRRDTIIKFGLFNTRYRISADYDFILRYFGIDDFKSIYIPNVLVNMRVGGASNKSISNVLKKSWEDFLIIHNHNKYLLKNIFTLFFKNIRKINQFF
jgi:glycosyltransferase involved in cell wall biosynthesis